MANHLKKRGLALLMTLIMALSLLPVNALAEGGEGTGDSTQTEESAPADSTGGASSASDDSQSTTPDDSQSTTPDDSQATTPDDGQATTPDDGQTTTPDDGQATTPDDGQATTPDDGQTTTPDDSQATTPDDGQTTAPDASQPAAPAVEKTPEELAAEAAAAAAAQAEAQAAAEAARQAAFEAAHPEITGEYTYQGTTVYVNAPVGAFPAGTTLRIEPVKNGVMESVVDAVKSLLGMENSTTLSTLLDNVDAATGEDQSAAGVVAFDITFTNADNEEVQPDPAYPVDVRFEVETDGALAEADELQVFHLEDAAAQATPVGEPVAVDPDSAKQVVSVSAESFSVYVIASLTKDGTTQPFTLETNGNLKLTQRYKGDWKITGGTDFVKFSGSSSTTESKNTKEVTVVAQSKAGTATITYTRNGSTTTYKVTVAEAREITFTTTKANGTKLGTVAITLTNTVVGTTNNNGVLTTKIPFGDYSVTATGKANNVTYQYTGTLTVGAETGAQTFILKPVTYDHIDIRIATADSGGDTLVLKGIENREIYVTTGGNTATCSITQKSGNDSYEWHSGDAKPTNESTIKFRATLGLANSTSKDATYDVTLTPTLTYGAQTTFSDRSEGLDGLKYYLNTLYPGNVSGNTCNISNRTYFEVANALCGQSTGLDFALTVQSIVDSSNNVIKGTKYLSTDGGPAVLSTEAFQFERYETNSTFSTTGVTPEVVSNGTSGDTTGKFSFTPIEVNAANKGYHYYVVKEKQVSGSPYDSTEYRVTINITSTQASTTTTYAATQTIQKVTAGEPVTVENIVFTNTKTTTGTVNITKVVEGLTDEQMASYSVPITVGTSTSTFSGYAKDQAGQWTTTVTVPMAPGTYGITEGTATDVPADMKLASTLYSVNGVTVTSGAAAQVTVTSGQTANVTVTNTYVPKVGSLTVTKAVTGLTADEMASYGYTVNVTLTKGNTTFGPKAVTITDATGTATFDNLPVGEYTVSEAVTVNNAEKFEKFYTDSTLAEDKTATATVVDGGQATAALTNAYTAVPAAEIPGDLKITKTFEGVADLSLLPPTVTVAVNNASYTLEKTAGYSLTIPVNAASTYTVTETVPEINGYKHVAGQSTTTGSVEFVKSGPDENNQVHYLVQGGTLSEGTVELKNVYTVAAHNFTIRKVVEWDSKSVDPDLKNDRFTISVQMGTAAAGETLPTVTVPATGIDYDGPGIYVFTLQGVKKASDTSGVTVRNVPEGTSLKLQESRMPNNFYSLDRMTDLNGNPISTDAQDLVMCPNDCGAIVYNSYFKSKTITVAGEKKWENSNDAPMPVSIEVTLTGSDGSTKTQTVTPQIKHFLLATWVEWNYSFKDLPKYAYNKETKAITEITYKVAETKMNYGPLSGVFKVEKPENADEFRVFGMFKTADGQREILGKWVVSEKGSNIVNAWIPAEDIGNGTFQVEKVDENGNPITTDKASFKLVTKNWLGKETVVGSVETNQATGLATFDGLQPGVYFLKETKAPDGYVKSTKEWVVTVVESKLLGTLNEVNVEKQKNFWDWLVVSTDGCKFENGVLEVKNQRVEPKLVEGTLTVTKTFAGDALETLPEIQVKVTLPGEGGEPAFTETKTLTLDAGTQQRTADFELPQAGTYTVEELGAAVDGYDLDVFYGDGEDSDATVAVESSYDFNTNTTTIGDGVMAITNTYARATGDLEVTKTVEGLPGEELPEGYSVTVNVTGADEYSDSKAIEFAWNSETETYTGTVSFENLKPGEYTVGETVSGIPAGYTQLNDDCSETAAVMARETTPVWMTNSYTPDLVVTKKFSFSEEEPLQRALAEAEGASEQTLPAGFQITLVNTEDTDDIRVLGLTAGDDVQGPDTDGGFTWTLKGLTGSWKVLETGYHVDGYQMYWPYLNGEQMVPENPDDNAQGYYCTVELPLEEENSLTLYNNYYRIFEELNVTKTFAGLDALTETQLASFLEGFKLLVEGEDFSETLAISDAYTGSGTANEPYQWWLRVPTGTYTVSETGYAITSPKSYNLSVGIDGQGISAEGTPNAIYDVTNNPTGGTIRATVDVFPFVETAVSGESDGVRVSFINTYSQNSQPYNPPPSGGGDGGDGGDGGTTIPSQPTPLNPGPGVVSVPEIADTEIPDGPVPLASAPKTGDSSALWAVAAAASGAGLLYLALAGRKRKEDDAR